jgi:transposase
LPVEAGEEKYTPRARAVLALSRYSLGVPFYRLEGFQALVGVPVADATQWDQAERVADCAYPVFEEMKRLAAQGEVIYQDDTHTRIRAVIKANRKAAEAMDSGQATPRTGMYTRGLVAHAGARTICLYFAGRAHAGENREGFGPGGTPARPAERDVGCALRQYA